MAAMSGPEAIRNEGFDVRSYEVDPSGRLTLRALCGYMQEAAGIHATHLGAGMGHLGTRGLAWVLHRLRLEVAETARAGERVSVTTWPREFGRMIAVRDFEVCDAGGRRLASATSRWAVVDLSARRAVRVPDFIRALPTGNRPTPVEGDHGPLQEVDAADLERRFEVRRTDLDVVDHVNNTRYVGWAVETVPDDVWEGCRPAALEILFQKEARFGEHVLARTTRIADEAGLRFAHELNGPDGSVLARAATRWEPAPGRR